MRVTVVALLGLASLAGEARASQWRPGPTPPANRTAADGMPLLEGLGDHHYLVTARPAAQAYFDQGLRLYWSADYPLARRSFREAEARDPDCVMCAWGVALAAAALPGADPALRDSARAAIERAQEHPGAVTDRERGLVQALARRVDRPAPSPAALDTAYAADLGQLVTWFGDDLEIRALHAEALMRVAGAGDWAEDGATPAPPSKRILGELERVLASDSLHPGGCHLFVHAVEPIDPARGLPCAERLAARMPAAEHLASLPVRLHLDLGRYDEALSSAERVLAGGRQVRRALGTGGDGSGGRGHALAAYAATMLGASRIAQFHASRAWSSLDQPPGGRGRQDGAPAARAYAILAAFARWDELLREPPPGGPRAAVAVAYYARGLAFAARRRWAEARAALDTVSSIAAGRPSGIDRRLLQIAEHSLAGEIALRRRDHTEALRELRAAVALDDDLPRGVPPLWYPTTRHALGRALLQAHRPREAERVFRQSLDRDPESGWSLFGLWQSLTRQGKAVEARTVRRRFDTAWRHADVAPPSPGLRPAGLHSTADRAHFPRVPSRPTPVTVTDPNSEPPSPEELARLEARLPAEVRFGTSTWTYPGWRGLVYHRDYRPTGQSAAMLAEYARFPLFRTVGIDSSFYGTPQPRTLTQWARALPPGFKCVSKVWERITVHTFAGTRDQARAGQRNPDFLSAELFEAEVWTPYRTYLGDHAGPFVFEFQTISARERISPDRFVRLLDDFLDRLPAEGEYGVEIRNEEFLTPAYFAVLREHDVAHVFNSWTRMPSLGDQLDLAGAITARFILCRALLRPGRTYAEAVDRFSPYDRIREPNPRLRRDLVRLVRTAAGLRLPAYVLVNNRAEGSAPLTITAVARLLAESEGDE